MPQKREQSKPYRNSANRPGDPLGDLWSITDDIIVCRVYDNDTWKRPLGRTPFTLTNLEPFYGARMRAPSGMPRLFLETRMSTTETYSPRTAAKRPDTHCLTCSLLIVPRLNSSLRKNRAPTGP